MAKTISMLQLVRLYDEIGMIYKNVQKPAGPEQGSLLLETYGGYSYEELHAAFIEYSRKGGKFAPAPSDLITLVNDAREIKARNYHPEDHYHYDSNGERIYSCPYCQDSGYMTVMLPDDKYGSIMAECVHRRPVTMGKLKTYGHFRFIVPEKKIDEVLVWSPKGYFVPEGSCVPEWEGDSLDASSVLAAATDLFGGKV